MPTASTSSTSIARGVLVQLVPHLPARNLQLDRLHRRPELLGDAVGPLDPDPPQVVDQLFRGRPLELGAAVGRGPDHRVQRLVDTEQVQAVPVGEPGRHEPGVGVELGEEVLADREQRPQVAVAQRDADVGEELLLGGVVVGIGGDDLLELVEEQHLVARLVVQVGPAARYSVTVIASSSAVRRWCSGGRPSSSESRVLST